MSDLSNKYKNSIDSQEISPDFKEKTAEMMKELRDAPNKKKEISVYRTLSAVMAAAACVALVISAVGIQKENDSTHITKEIISEETAASEETVSEAPSEKKSGEWADSGLQTDDAHSIQAVNEPVKTTEENYTSDNEDIISESEYDAAAGVAEAQIAVTAAEYDEAFENGSEYLWNEPEVEGHYEEIDDAIAEECTEGAPACGVSVYSRRNSYSAFESAYEFSHGGTALVESHLSDAAPREIREAAMLRELINILSVYAEEGTEEISYSPPENIDYTVNFSDSQGKGLTVFAGKVYVCFAERAENELRYHTFALTEGENNELYDALENYLQ